MTHPRSNYHQKLVRDRIPQRIEAGGERCEWRNLSNRTHFLHALAAKLTEEAKEAATSLDRLNLFAEHAAHDPEQLGAAVLEELADVQAVLNEALAAIGKSSLDLNNALCEKLRTHGGYQHRIFLERTWKEEE